MELKDVTTFLDTNKDNDEVKNFLKGFYTPEKLNPLLDSEDGLKIIQPRLDRHFNKGLETWKANNLPKILDEEISKRNPGETPEQKRLKDLEAKIKDTERETARVKLTSFATTKLSEFKIPLKLASFVIGDDEVSTLQNIKDLKENWDAELEKRVNEVFKLNGRKRPGSEEKKTPSTKMNDYIRMASGRQ